jgi:hypothetical protein
VHGVENNESSGISDVADEANGLARVRHTLRRVDTHDKVAGTVHACEARGLRCPRVYVLDRASRRLVRAGHPVPAEKFRAGLEAGVSEGRRNGGESAPMNLQLSTTRLALVLSVWEKTSAGVRSGWEMRTSLRVR